MPDALGRIGAGAVAQDDSITLGQTWPARLAKQIWGAVTLPGDVYAGRVDPNSDEAIRRSADLAMTAPLAGIPAAEETALGSAGSRLPMDTASRMQRAKDLGFTLDAYHGTSPKITEQIAQSRLFDPTRNKSEPATFFTPAPYVAETYGEDVLPVKINPSNYAVVDLRDTGASGLKLAYRSEYVRAAIDAAKAAGKDGVIIRSMIDKGPRAPDLGRSVDFSDQILMLNPKTVRSKAAAFDPEKRDSSDIFSANPGAGSLAPIMQNTAPAENSRQRNSLLDALLQQRLSL